MVILLSIVKIITHYEFVAHVKVKYVRTVARKGRRDWKHTVVSFLHYI